MEQIKMGLIILLVAVTSVLCEGQAKELVDLYKRQTATPPSETCDSSSEGTSTGASGDMIWVCRSSTWTPFRLTPAVGSSRTMSGSSCKRIKEQLTGACSEPLSSGMYWVQGTQIYCDMDELDGGGWTLAWQHSYTENYPLTNKMTYFSNDFQACTTRASGWCNIPNKARFSATEQMIVAYHEGTVVYAYKGLFNRNIDFNWSGAILLDPVKIVDRCTQEVGIQPAPENKIAVGFTFDKWTPYNYKANCDTYSGTYPRPNDCRWENCKLPSSISSKADHVQMTVAIFMR